MQRDQCGRTGIRLVALGAGVLPLMWVSDSVPIVGTVAAVALGMMIAGLVLLRRAQPDTPRRQQQP